MLELTVLADYLMDRRWDYHSREDFGNRPNDSTSIYLNLNKCIYYLSLIHYVLH